MGVDVGGVKKGFHAACLDLDSRDWRWVVGFLTVEEVVAAISREEDARIVAVDAPRRGVIRGPLTRLSERQLARRGFKVQFTRRAPMEAPEWMEHGEKLWSSLESAVGQVRIVETFPTWVSGKLGECGLDLPLRMLAGGPVERRTYGDRIDACLCAWAGSRVLSGEAEWVGFDPSTGEEDELGRIWA